ncbi:MAG: flagellar assembly protein FliX [Pseudolabrys sp.]
MLWAERNRTCGNTDSRPRTGGGSFTVREDDSPRNAASTGSLRAISTVDALIALQGVDDPKERKKQALVKGRNAFDVSSIPSSLDCSTEAWTNQRSHASRWHPRA